MWDTELKSLFQAVKKAQGDLVKETNKIKNQRARNEEKAAKKQAAKAKAAAKAMAAPEDGGDELTGIEAWKLYESASEFLVNPTEAPWRQAPIMPAQGDSWEPDMLVPSILPVDVKEVNGYVLEGEVGKMEVTLLPEWYEMFPSASGWLEQAVGSSGCVLLTA